MMAMARRRRSWKIREKHLAMCQLLTGTLELEGRGGEGEDNITTQVELS